MIIKNQDILTCQERLAIIELISITMTNVAIFSGSRISSKYNIYNYGDSCYISLEIKGNKFSGYDYGTSSHFSGNVRNKSVSVYDYEDSLYYNYSI